jgi:hypothetical protein
MKKIKEKKDLESFLLTKCVGKKKAKSMLALSLIFYTTTRQIRSEIEKIRQKVPLEGGYCLVSHNEGYWVSKDVEEIKSFLKRYLGTAAKQFKNARQTIKQLNREEQAKIQAQFVFEEELTDLQKKFAHAIIPSGDKVERKRLGV